MFLNRFLALFDGKSNIDRYPEEMLRQAIERAVDATNPWLRGVSGYHKRLRPAIRKAVDHSSALASQLNGPIHASLDSYDSDPRLRAFFISAVQMQQIFAQDQTLKEYRATASEGHKSGCALLLMEMEEKKKLGVAQVGGMMLHETPQVTVSFSEHRFFDVTPTEEETRNLLKRRAFDHLVSLALTHITLANTERKDLLRQNTLLQAKLNTFQRGGFWHSALDRNNTLNLTELQEQKKQIEARLQLLGDSNDSLNLELDLLIDVLENPDQHLWATRSPLILDRMGIKRAHATTETPPIELEALHNTRGRNVVVALVAFE